MIQGGGKLFAGSSGRHIGVGTFRTARSRRRRAEILLPLRVRSRSRRHQRARHSSAALARWLAGRGRQLRRPAPTKSSRRGRERRSKWRCRACRSAAREGEAGAAGGREAAANAASPPPSRPRSQRRTPRRSSANWPAGPVDVRMAPYMVQAQQKWTITPVANAGGYPGSPFFKITIAGTDRALAATADAELAVRARLHRRARTTVAHRSAHRRHLSA